MDKFQIRIKRERKPVGRIIRINQEACDTLNALCEEYGLENACQLVSDMILFCSDRAELVEED